jgi:uncharacterized repeat protein (TIGR01451 family)
VKSFPQSRHPRRRMFGARPLYFVIALLFTALIFVGGAGATLKAAFFQDGDILVTKTGPDTAQPNTNIVYTITVATVGPDDIGSATLMDSLPTGETFVSLSTPPPGWSCSDPGVGNNGTISCSADSVPAGSNDIFTLTVHIDPSVPVGTFLTNSAVVSGFPDNTDENDTSTISTLIPAPSADIGVTKSVNPANTLTGRDVTFSITALNNGPDAANSTTLTDTLPLDMTFVSLVNPAGWSCSTPSVGSGGTINCSKVSLAVTNGEVFTLVGHIPPSSPGPSGTNYENTATVSTTTDDPNPENNSSTATTTALSCLTGLVVTNNADSGVGSLRQAIADVCDGATITFDMTQVVSPIALTSAELAINKNLTIQGPGASLLTVQRSTAVSTPDFRIFDITSGTVAISGLTVSNGNVANEGGGIFNGGTLTLTNVTVSGNQITATGAPFHGGGVASTGTLTLTNSIVSGNSAAAPGAFLSNGGGVADLGGTLTVSSTTVSGNSASRAGGLYTSGGTLNLINSSISGNSATAAGGGIFNDTSGTTNSTNCTITNNRSDSDNSGGEQGGGIIVNAGTVTLKNTIVAGNFRGTGTTRDDVSGALDPTGSFNLIGDGTNMTGISNGSNSNQVGSAGSPINALLAALGNYGGPTQTHALLPGSPAINSGSNTIANNASLTTDQRGPGFNRIVNTTVDIGAFESSGFTLTATSGTPQSAGIGSAFALPLVASIAGLNGEPVNGGIVTFTAPASGAAATLTGGTNTANVTIAGGQASTNATANGLAGSYSVSATAIGSTPAAFNLTNNKGNTAITLISSANPAVFGQVITFTATVSAVAPAPGGPTGTVTFLDGGNPIVTVGLSGGVANLTTSNLPVGTHTITAAYNGDANFNSNTVSLTGNPQVVNKANTTTAITSSQNPSVFGQPVTFTATVSVNSPGTGTPTGTVTFLDGGNSIGTASLGVGGVANLTTSALSVGNHTITATYNGDGNFNSSTGSLTGNPQVVNKANTASTVTSSLNPSIFGQPVTFTATVAASAPGSGTPTGTVIFLDGGNSIGTATLNSGVATITTSVLAPGNHTITTSYNGDGNFNVSAGSLTGNPQVVNKANTTTTLSSSLNPSVFGQPVTFTATVSPVAPGAGTPAGTVTFLDGGNSIGTGTLSGGVASFTTSALTAGNHTISASYNGDTNFNGSTGSLTGNPQVVNKANTTTAITSSVNPSDFGQPVTFTATISAVAPGAGAPTGAVQFKDNGNNLGAPVTLSGSVAQVTTSSLSIGSHVITADYPGDGNFVASSGTLAGGQTVRFRPLIKFSQPTYSVNENGNFITINVVRSGDTTPAVTVDYATPDDSAATTFVPCSTANGVASPRCDFTTALGTLSFGPGETSKSFTVLISQDSWVEGNETVALTLSNPTGGAGFQQPSDANAVLTIVDDDVTPPTTNAIDNSDTFVRQHYHDFLNREADAPGLAFWTNQIESCGTDAQCRAARRVNVSAAFFLSIEFQNTGYFVERMYKAGFGDINPPAVPVPVRFTNFLQDTQQVRGDVIVGSGNWQAQLDANKKAYALAFVQRTAFMNRYPGLISATAFVDSLNANAGLVLSDSERSALIAELSPNPSDPALRADVLQKVAENALLQQREFNRAFVLMQYFGYLRRNPDAAPEPTLNFNGYNFWLNKLNQFNGDYIGAEMIKGFITSGEYRGRFGP